MKRKILAGLLVAALSLSAAMSAFAASSVTTSSKSSSGGSSSGGGNSVSTATIDTTGIVTSTTTTAATSATSTADGVALQSTQVGGVTLSFAVGVAETAGLPSSVVATISNINTGVSLNAAGTGLDLDGYSALVSTAALRTEDASGNEVKGGVSVPVYIPNLVEGLGTIQILFYDNFGTWTLITPSSIDYASKTVNFTAPNSGTFTVIYK